MVLTFEQITKELDEDEKKLVPILISGFKTHYKENPITEPDIVKAINNQKDKYLLKKKLTSARLRKLCNFIRVNGLLPLIATSNGYFISYDQEDLRKQIISLEQRARSIMNASNGLRKFLN